MSLQINFIWLGTGKLRPLDLFNIYSWRALGHAVTIYAFHFNGSHDTTSLGLVHSGAAAVVDLPKLIETDNEIAEKTSLDDPDYLDILKKTANTRFVIKAWYTAAALSTSPTIEHIYNMADITKSYIAGTRRGIVLDLKVGPSEHVRSCEMKGVFKDYFISYKRGSSTFGDLPENQCMGTMQIANTLRGIYIKRFDSALSAFKGHIERAKKPNEKQFDNLTGFHGRGWMEVQKKRKALDVTNRSQMFNLGLFGLTVKEIGDEVSYGPFRVFKRIADQTNTSMATTSLSEQIRLCHYVCGHPYQRRLVVNQEFDKERKKVFKVMPVLRLRGG